MSESFFQFEIIETPTRGVKISLEKSFALAASAGAHQDPLPVFEEFVNKSLAKGYTTFLVDLRQVPFPTARFIALLIALTVRARRRQGDIKLINLSETARNNFVTFNPLNFLTIEREDLSSNAPASEATRKPAPAKISNVPPVVGEPAIEDKGPAPSVAKSMPMRRPQPSKANAPPSRQKNGAPASPSSSPRREDFSAAAPSTAVNRSSRELPKESTGLEEEKVALVDIVDPPLVKELAKEMDEPAPAVKESSFSIRVESRASNLYQLCEFVTGHAAIAGITEKEIGKIRIAVYEACLNVIEHAYHSRPDEWIDMQVRYTPEKFMIIIQDTGLSVEMKPPKPYDIQEVVNERRSGGFGLHIITRSMDQINYHPDPVHGNRLVMVKRLRP